MRDDFLDLLSLLIKQRIEADSYFSDVPVYEERKGLITSEIQLALSTLNQKAGKRGVVVIVRMPAPDRSESQAPTPFLRVILEVDVIEDTQANSATDGGTGKSSAEVWSNLARLLADWRCDVITQYVSLAESPFSFREEEGELMTTLRLTCYYPVKPRGKVAIGEDLEVELVSGSTYRARVTVPTAGASVYFKFTPDGDAMALPNPATEVAVASATWHSFTRSAAGDLLVVAYKTDSLASDVRHARLN